MLSPGQKIWFEKNRERLRAYKKIWYIQNKEKHKETGRRWVRKNPKRSLEIKQRWQKKKGNQHRQNRLRNDPAYRIREYLRSRIRLALKECWKSGKTMELLGCSINFFRSYLETAFQPGMTWENYGKIWHVDHRRPCASFDLNKPEQQRECFHWSNCQSLFARDNLIKGDSLC
jgi:hypothetical protein